MLFALGGAIRQNWYRFSIHLCLSTRALIAASQVYHPMLLRSFSVIHQKGLPWYFWIFWMSLTRLIINPIVFGCLQDWFSVGSSTVKWFSSYLTEHYQCVKIGSTLSNILKLLFDTSGSVLGPLIFSMYISPLNTLIGKHQSINISPYALLFTYHGTYNTTQSECRQFPQCITKYQPSIHKSIL